MQKNSEEKILFTKRELKIIQLVAEGYTNKEIAYKMSLSQHTIKYELTNIFEKCHAKNRVHAVYILTLKGYINYSLINDNNKKG